MLKGHFLVKKFFEIAAHLRPTLLILNGYGSPLTNPIVSRATEENIPIVLLPPHTTNVLQPLDVGLFRFLKAKLSKITDAIKPWCN